ncbi:hypothetical protein ANO11243_084160 [Dothideomycetidae sp. 11243]|nr:hypothetical protein ANO11243_084160 [fungal sp. No.11243]
MATQDDRTSSASPIGKLGRLRKSRAGRDTNLSSPSIGSSSTDGDDGVAATRVSTESLHDRLKFASRRSSEDKRSTKETSRLSKLIPSKIKNRRKSAVVVDGDDRPGMLLPSADTGLHSGHLTHKSSSTSLSKGSMHSSLMTDDSEQEGAPVRPILSPHESHSGYLTISAPQINAQTTIPIITATPADDDDISPGATPGSTEGQPGLQTTQQASRPHLERRNSPVDKIKSAFTLGKKKPSFEADVAHNPSTIQTEGVVHNADEDDTPTTVRRRPSVGDTTIVGNQELQKPSKASLRDTARPAPIITSNGRPTTPPSQPLDAPSTLVTPPTPTLPSPAKSDAPTPSKFGQSPSSTTQSPARSKPKGFSLGSLTGSKSSNVLSNPLLTPPIEEAKTPGGSLTSGGSLISPTSAGFFSSVLSAAQSAATQLSNPFAQGSQGARGKPGPAFRDATSFGSLSSSDLANSVNSRHERKISQPVSTTHPLGIASFPAEDSDISPMNMPSATQASDTASRNGDDAIGVAQSVQAAYEKPAINISKDAPPHRPKSIASQRSFNAEQSPSRSPAVQSEASEFKRSGSIRSKLSDRRKGRKRESSVGTANTLGPPGSTANSLAPTPSISSGFGHRLTGFAVASSKRNKDFHQLFRSVPEDDYLIEDYSAALQRDILLHGRFYVSEGHICFSSNILGWVTNLVIAFDEIITIEKKNTAIVFPNALVIQTQHSRNVFASFVTRDSTFDLLLGIWRTSHPNLRVTPNSISLDSASEHDKPEKAESTGSEEGSEDGSDDVYDEDAEEEDDLVSMTEVGANGSIAGSDVGDIAAALRKPSSMPVQTASPPMAGAVPKGLEGSDTVVTGAAVTADYPGQPTHEPTECGDSASHYDRPLIDTTIQAPLGKIYSIWFGPASGAFMRKWLVEDQKSRELAYEDDKIGMDENHKTFTYSYIKPLNAPVGPKQTKCIVTANLQAFDLDKAITVDCSTQTPDVPSGNIFVTRTRYCLMWGPGNSTRVVATCTIEWSGKSWLKGPIEKGANDGQTSYVNSLIASLRAAVTTRAPVKGMARGKKGKRKGRETFDTVGTDAELGKTGGGKIQDENWGLLEPLRPFLSPFTDLLQPMISPQVVIAVLLLLLVQSWFFPSLGWRRSSVGLAGTGPERLAAYEALWAREEAELWDWLEERTGLDQGLLAVEQGQKVLAKAMNKKVKEKSMELREMDEAIRIMDEKMDALKDAVARRKGQ